MTGKLSEIFIKIVFMILIGYFLAKKGVLTKEIKKGLSDILVKAILPITILSSSGYEFSSECLKGIGITVIISLIYYGISIIFTRVLVKKLSINDGKKRAFIAMSVFANTGFIGIPLAFELYGTEGMLYAVAYNMCFNLVFFSYGTILFSGEKKMSIQSLRGNVVVICSVISIVMYVLPFRIPSFVYTSLNSVGCMTVPISMFVIGAEMAAMKRKEIISDSYSYMISAIRLLFFPLMTGIVGCMLHLNPIIICVCVLATGLPSGSLNVIWAQQYDCEPEFAARTVVQTMLFMMITIPVLLFVTSKVFLRM